MAAAAARSNHHRSRFSLESRLRAGKVQPPDHVAARRDGETRRDEERDWKKRNGTPRDIQPLQSGLSSPVSGSRATGLSLSRSALWDALARDHRRRPPKRFSSRKQPLASGAPPLCQVSGWVRFGQFVCLHERTRNASARFTGPVN